MRTLIILTTLFMLTACGQKGPLYLPEPSAGVEDPSAGTEEPSAGVEEPSAGTEEPSAQRAK